MTPRGSGMLVPLVIPRPTKPRKVSQLGYLMPGLRVAEAQAAFWLSSTDRPLSGIPLTNREAPHGQS